MAKQSLLEDPRYAAFVERYHADPLRFAVEVCDVQPSDDQAGLYDAMAPQDAKVSVVSGTGTGKTMTFARIGLWHMLCHPMAIYDGKVEIGSNTYIGAPLVQQVGDGVWKEAQDAKIAISNGPCAWIASYFNIGKTRITVNGFEDQWFVAQVALQQGKAVGVAGKHRYWQLIIIDEAAGVSDDHFDVIDGTQTQGGNRTLMASQGVRPSGRFYDSHHKLSHHQGGSWHALRFSSENSPFVKTKWIKEREEESGGRDSAEFQIRVLGLFPEQTDKFLLGRSSVERRIRPACHAVIDDTEAYGNMIIIDVGAGVYRDKTVVTHVRVIGSGDRIEPDSRRIDVMNIPLFSNGVDWEDAAGRAFDYGQQLSNCTYIVDIGGQGVQFAKILERMGAANVIHSNWGNPCFKKKNKARFYNLRAQCSVHAAEAVKDGRITFNEQYQKNLLDEASRIPFHFDEKARFHIMPKEKMKEDGIPSPDLWDTICMAFLENATYIQAQSENVGISSDRRSAALAAAADAFADIE